MKRLVVLTLISLILVTSLVSCSNQNSPPSEITFTPLELYTEDTKKFKPFVGTMSGAFKLNYKGNKPNAILNVDIWKNGAKTNSAGSVLDLFFSPNNPDNQEVEVIVSMDLVSIEEDKLMQVKVSINNNGGYTFTTFSVPWDKRLLARGLIAHNAPFNISNEQSVHVFGMQATSSNAIRTADFSTGSLSNLEYAIILTVTLDE